MNVDQLPRTARKRWPIWVIGVAAIVIHAALAVGLIAWKGRVDGFAGRTVDSAEYLALAENLRQHHCFSRDTNQPRYPETYRTPGYPLLLAGVQAVFDGGATSAVLTNLVLGALVVITATVVARPLVGAPLAAAVGALLLLAPYRLYYSLWVMSEPLFVLLLLVALGCWLRWGHEQKRWFWLAAAGLVLGAATLVRPIGLPLLPLGCVAAALLPARQWQRRLGRAGLLLVSFLLIVGPWLGRNYALFDRVRLTTIGASTQLYFKSTEVLLWRDGRTDDRYDLDAMGEHWQAVTDRLRAELEQRGGPLTAEQRADLIWQNIAWGKTRTINPFELAGAMRTVGFQLLVENPWSAASCYAWRSVSGLTFPLTQAIAPPSLPHARPFAGLLGPDRQAAGRAIAAGVGTLYLLLALAGAWGAVRVLRRRMWFVGLSLLLPAAMLLIATLPQMDPRFRLPIEPLMLMLAALGVWVGGRRPAGTARASAGCGPTATPAGPGC